ncbi:arginine/serine-rich coiled-coil protein 2-like [Hylaeus volcanicus]|uniref:arginine/serine-rich coiled-coil protein 2-like n=1 Tax=Hylaeus volcanicus TaxID=313075 RepID=UPI0023B793AC|nr:arginine/serine-rich coiled-coil protein 2-like [Hylaeus volcanicus]
MKVRNHAGQTFPTNVSAQGNLGSTRLDSRNNFRQFVARFHAIMDSLANYASDGDNSNNSEDSKMPYETHNDASKRASDANYDPVQMDMSEESNNNNSSRESSSERANSPVTQTRTESSRTLPSPSDQRRSDHENYTANSKEDQKRGDRSERSKHTSDKGRRSSYDDRRQRESSHRDRETKRSRDDDRKSRDDDKKKEKSSLGSSREEKTDDREKSRDDRRDRNRDRSDRDRDRRRDRDRDRDRRHSRDDRTKDRHRDDRSTYHKEKDRTRSRSRSRDRAPPPFRTMSYREEKSRNKLAQLEKLGIELKAPEGDAPIPGVQSEQNYYNPLATASQGKYAEQIQKRKLLWANKSKQDECKTSTAASTANTWVGTTFTHDQDGKVTAKFKRLMGIKDDLPATPAAGAKPDILKKQEEMFNNMEQQYEVARATTHTQRGVGLGYATGGYQFPR